MSIKSENSDSFIQDWSDSYSDPEFGHVTSNQLAKQLENERANIFSVNMYPYIPYASYKEIMEEYRKASDWFYEELCLVYEKAMNRDVRNYHWRLCQIYKSHINYVKMIKKSMIDENESNRVRQTHSTYFALLIFGIIAFALAIFWK